MSIAPMSMPSSSDEVATSARRPPLFRRSSISTRCGAGDRPVMRSHQRFSGELVQRPGQTFREPPTVHEDERRLVGANHFEQPGVDGRPDRRARIADRRWAAGDVVGSGEPRHILDRHLDRDVQRLARAGVDDRHRPIPDGSRRRELFVEGRGARLRRLKPRLSRGASRVAPQPRSAAHGRTAGGLVRNRRENARPPRAVAVSPTVRSAAARPRSGPRGARSRAPDGRRAWSARARGSRRR